MSESRMGDNIISKLTNSTGNEFKVLKTEYPFRFAVSDSSGKKQEFDIRRVIEDDEVFISVSDQKETSKGEIVIGTARPYQADAFRYAQWFFSQEINEKEDECIYTRTLTAAQAEQAQRFSQSGSENIVKIKLIKVDNNLTSNDALTSFIFEREKYDRYTCVISTDKNKVEPWTTFRLWYGYMCRVWDLDPWNGLSDEKKSNMRQVYEAEQKRKSEKSKVVKITSSSSVSIDKSIVETPTDRIEIVLENPRSPSSGGKRRTRKNRSKSRFTS